MALSKFKKSSLANVKVVKQDEKGIAGEILLAESVPQLKDASFLWMVWDPYSKRLTFLSRFNESSSVHAVSWLGKALDRVYDKVPVELYSTGQSPIRSAFPVAYVER